MADDYIDPPTDEDDDLYDEDYSKKKVENIGKKDQINMILNNKIENREKEEKINYNSSSNNPYKVFNQIKDINQDLRHDLKPNIVEKSPKKEVLKPFVRKSTKTTANVKSTEKLNIKSPNINEIKSPKNVKFEEDLPTHNYVNKIDKFEKKLKNDFEYNYKDLNDSDFQEDLIKDEIDPTLTDKETIIKRFNILKEKLNEKENQIKLLQKTLDENRQKQKEFMDSIAKDTNIDLKEKKIIELAKKNSDLMLKIEKFKTLNKELEKKLLELSTTNQNLGINKENNINSLNNKDNKKELQNNIDKNNNNNNEESSTELKKKLKIIESKIVEMRNKNQILKDENSKLIMVLKKEIGENCDIEKLLKGNEKAGWKGRAEQVEYLKSKIKNMENQINITNSVLNAEDPKKLFLKDEKMIYKNDPKKEKEILKQENERLKEENNKIAVESSRVRSRKEVLEKEIKFQKEDFTNKIKILLEKSDNDEKLIAVLNREMEKLRLSGGAKINLNNNYNYNENPVFNLQQENAKLRKDLREKEAFINNLNTSLVNENSNSKGDNNPIASFSSLVTKLKALEEENKTLKQDDNGKVYEQIAKDNAKLRLKIRELEEKLNK